MFLGNKELFKGTYAYKNWNFNKKSKVVKLDMSSVDSTSPELLLESLTLMITSIEEEYGIEHYNTKSPHTALNGLIRALTGKHGVVILIDEYDSPLLKNIYKPKLKEIKDILSNFYSQLKANEEYIRFVFLTGITKLSKVGVFSALNNLSDISLKNKYSSICGYTKEDILYYFSDNISECKKELELTDDMFWDKLKTYYNGYTWDGETSMFNPFSILNFFDNLTFRPYWMETCCGP